jgi:D-alanyl-lipoteichoic acid acyltransferase DltB (MBOAT superfamily)
MLFNSYVFIFAFLPISLLLTYGAGRWNQSASKVVLLLLSLAFYAHWRVAQLPLLLGSIAFNFAVGELMQRARAANRPGQAEALMRIGVLADLAFLGWFKYANFFVDNVNWVAGTHIHLAHIALPLAISFFTFQKIAYLIDTARGETRRTGALDFSLFAAFYPQLIAGPIVHFKEVMPQLQARLFGRFVARNMMVGLVTFSIGLFKKTVIADTLSAYVNPLYARVGHGHELSLAAAWVAAAGYTLQLYFDFSGYSDMAIGLGRMLGVKLPLNFHSPLRAPSIIDYWRRWHMTLQRFIVAYIFQPLSLPLNRLAAEWGLLGWSAFVMGAGLPVFVTFVAVGLWHGAGWTFVLFGVMHGIYLSVNEAWREWLARRRRKLRRAGKTPAARRQWQIVAGHLLTLVAVIYSQVMFRSANPLDAVWIWRSMTGLDHRGIIPAEGLSGGLFAIMAAAAAVVFLMPNSQQIMGRFDPAYNWREWRHVAPAPLPWTWKPNVTGVIFAGAILLLGVIFIERGQAVFLYFNF